MNKFHVERVRCASEDRVLIFLLMILYRILRSTSRRRHVHYPYAVKKHLVSSEVDSEQFDSRKGATWHCIVGRNFGSFVTHGLPSYALEWKVYTNGLRNQTLHLLLPWTLRNSAVQNSIEFTLEMPCQG